MASPTGPGGAYRSSDDGSPFEIATVDDLSDDLNCGKPLAI